MKTGIHIQPCNIGTAEAHNVRDAEYMARLDASGKKSYDIFRDETHLNTSLVSTPYEGRTLDQVLLDMKAEVKEKTGRAMQAKATPIREGVCPIKKETELSDFAPVVDWFNQHKVSVIRIDIHRDEGHIDAVTGERKHNYHAHLVLDFIDHDSGKSVKLSKTDMSQLQDIIAESLHMDRGTPKAETGAEHLSVLEYREKMVGEQVRELENRFEANKSSIKNTLADVGARALALFDKGQLVEARQERDAAILEATDALKMQDQMFTEMQKAKEAQKEAEIREKLANQGKSRMEREMAAYGLEKYKEGQTDGYREATDKLNPIIEELEYTQSLTELFLPNSKNIAENYDTMKNAGMADEDIKDVFRTGKKENCTVLVDNYRTNAVVDLANNTNGKFKVWFNDQNWTDFCEEFKKSLRTSYETIRDNINSMIPRRKRGIHR